MLSSRRVATFDCWGTLLRERDIDDAVARRFERFGAMVQQHSGATVAAHASRSLSDAWQRHATVTRNGGATGSPEVAQWALEAIGIVDPGFCASVAAMLSETTSTAGIEALPGAAAALSTLADEGWDLGLVCNTGLVTGSTTRRLLEESGLSSRLRCAIFSDEVGATKPDPRPFRAALKTLGAAAEEALHVGDDVRTDICGARAAGIRSVRLWGRPSPTGPPCGATFVARDFGHLLEWMRL